MCVAALAWEAHPDWRLVAIGNRDEYHARPAAALAQWNDGSGVLAGRDLQSGGTWLGVSAAARFVLVTNLRGYGAPDPALASRGALVTDLLGLADPASVELDGYNPFNLFVADPAGLHFLCNRPAPMRTALGHGIYGLSNGTLDEPWPKTLQLKAALTDWLAADETRFDPLFAALRSETPQAIGLPSDEPSDVPLEAAQTGPFIRHPLYGTRCSTVVAMHRNGRGAILERSFDSAGNQIGEAEFAFFWDSPDSAPR